MAPATVYTTSAAPPMCERCHAVLPAGSSVNRLFCDRCRDVRRAITWLNQAAYQLSAHRGAAGIDAAYDHVHSALEELGG